ncbi:MAG TPA: tetratricopeptide repeat protein [Anaerolineae bacterium]|nr:tetratricopeptide repeat protein [Anaerolineae bacterium]
MSSPTVIRTPDQRLRVFVSSTLQELADERAAAREAITRLRLAPVLFELGARPHPPRDLYRAYLDQSHLFIGIYWQRYGWIAPGETLSGLEDEYRLSGPKPKLLYIKQPAPDREPRLKEMLDRIKGEDAASYKYFSTAAELRELIESDVALLLTERFEQQQATASEATGPQRPNNLPVPRNPLVDREWETTSALDLLLRQDVALLTLTGAGGTGKSRLALHLALELLEHFEDGAFLVRLSPLNDPDLVVAAIAQTLDVRETPGASLLDSLKAYLHDRRLLLLLDNFEHVIAAAPLVGELLEACPRLKFIVTSRAPLHIRAERELPVPPLALPDRHLSPDAENLSQYAAVKLFIQRAQALKADFAVTNDNAPAVAEICHRLDGLPLGIELAAARVKLLSPQALLARLEHRLEVLTSGTRDLPARQQTLRSAIAWSYDLLDQKARTLFHRLSVFVGGWTLEAAEAVCNAGGDLGFEVMDELEALVDNSLLTQAIGSDGERRYGMLATIREYALERLMQSGEADTLRRRHADFLLQLAETAAPHLTSGRREPWLAALEIELDNLRAALAWSKSGASDAELGLRLAGALDWFWFFRGHLSEGRAWLEEIVTRPRHAGRTASKARVLGGAGGLAWAQGDYAAARTRLEESLAIGRDIGASGKPVLAQSLMFLGFVNVNQGHAEAARALHTESLALSRAAGDRWLQALTLSNLGDALLMSGDAASARSRYEESLALFEGLEDPWGRAIVLYALGSMALAQGDHAAARAFFEESTSLSRSLGDRWSIARGLLGAASAALSAGDVRPARDLFRESLSLEHEIGNLAGVVMSLAGLACAAATQKDLDRTAQLAGAVDVLGKTVGSRLWHSLRPIYEGQMAAARAQSDTSTWMTQYTIGQALTLEQAVAYALPQPG